MRASARTAEVTTRLMTPEAAVERARWRCSARNTATRCASSRWADGEGDKPAYSIELCGGTHVRAHRRYRPVQDRRRRARSAAGVRRIEAVTGEAALALVAETERRLHEAAAALRASPAEVPERVAALLEERRRLERQVAELQQKLATGGGARRGRGGRAA